MSPEKLPEHGVSVIIPCRNERGHIDRVLDDLAAQDYDGPMEVIVADGESNDGTWESLQAAEVSGKYRFALRTLCNRQRIIPAALNLAVAAARGKYIVRVDAHARLEPSYVSTIVGHLASGEMDVVGPSVRWVPRRENVVSTAIATVLNAKAGNGGTPGRVDIGTPKRTEHAVMSCYRRHVWSSIGGYDESMLSNEDFEFDYRAHAAGFRVYSLPRPRYDAVARADIPQLAKQRWRYGYWKGHTIVKHPASLKVRQLVPGIFVPASLVCIGFFPVTALALLLAYALLAAWIVGTTRDAYRKFRGGALRAWPVAMLSLILTHYAWALGLWWGLGVALARSLSGAKKMREQRQPA